MPITLQMVTTHIKSLGMKYQSRANLTNLEKGLIGPSDELLEKLAAHYDIEINTLKSWRGFDEYGPKVGLLIGQLSQNEVSSAIEEEVKKKAIVYFTNPAG